MRKRHTTSDPTANEVVRSTDDYLADDLRRRQRVREQETYNRNERIRRAREAALDEGGAA